MLLGNPGVTLFFLYEPEMTSGWASVKNECNLNL